MEGIEGKVKVNDREFRKNPTTKEWVIVCEDRLKRPIDLVTKKKKINKISDPSKCHFCYGNEDKTPPEVWVWNTFGNGRTPNTPYWDVRIVSNKFPALMIEECETIPSSDDLDEKMLGIGIHEVVIESPDSSHPRFEELSINQIYKVFFGVRERMIDLEGDKRLIYIQYFRNQGEGAGASLEHPHSQLIGVPIIPKDLENELYVTSANFKKRRVCTHCEIIEKQLITGERLIYNNDKFIAYTNFAPKYSYETVISPIEHKSDFKHISNEEIMSLAEILKLVLSKINMIKEDDVDYNMYIYNSPTEVGKAKYIKINTDESSHWHVELLPKLHKHAGFELGTGISIIPVRPEHAAEYLRNVNVLNTSIIQPA